MKAERLGYIHYFVSLLLMAATGFLTGYTLSYFHTKRESFPEIKPVAEMNRSVTTLQLFEARGGKLKGRVAGQPLRLAVNAGDIRTLAAGESFELALNSISLADWFAAAGLPADALFTASAKGQYYYSVDDKRAYGIAENNRVYFESRSEAENRGFLPAK